jgi:hypothetical protein
MSSITLSGSTSCDWINTVSENRVHGKEPESAYLIGFTGRLLIQF